MKYRTIVVDPPWQIDDFPAWGWEGDPTPRPYPVMRLEDIAALPVKDLSDNLDGDAFLFLWTINDWVRDSYDIARGWGFHPSALLVWCKPPRPGGLGGVFPANTEFILYCRRPKVVSRPDVLRVTSRVADLAERAGVSRRAVDLYMGTTDMGGWWLSRIEHRCAVPTNEQWERLKSLMPELAEMDAEVHRINAAKGLGERQAFERVDSRWFTWPRGTHSRKPEAFLDLVEQVSPGPYLELFARRNRLGWDTWGNECLEHVEVVGT